MDYIVVTLYALGLIWSHLGRDKPSHMPNRLSDTFITNETQRILLNQAAPSKRLLHTQLMFREEFGASLTAFTFVNKVRPIIKQNIRY